MLPLVLTIAIVGIMLSGLTSLRQIDLKKILAYATDELLSLWIAKVNVYLGRGRTFSS
jgi:NADH:ubiquinone oxidoreductase subunit 4 (subunit M)